MLEEKVLKTIKENGLINQGDSIVVGVSGGPDSMTLLNILINIKNTKKMKFNLSVAHINHGIRKEADEETKYVEDFCKKNNINCYVKKEKVEQLAKQQKIGTEEAGRKVRYSFFEEVIKKEKANKIATAHTANDNAETVLMNIIRGAGTSGLKGIELNRENKFIRPLLECTRQEIEEYCKENNLQPKEDKSNKENIYTRNKIRNELLPYIEKEFNPNIIVALNRLSNLAKEENYFFEEQVKNIYNDIKIEECLGDNPKGENKKVILDLKKFNLQETVIKNRLVRYTINRLFGTSKDIEKIHIFDIVKLCKNNIGNKFLLPNKNLKVLVNKGKIFFIKLI